MGLEADYGAVSKVEGWALIALVRLLPQLRPLDQVLAEMQFLV